MGLGNSEPFAGTKNQNATKPPSRANLATQNATNNGEPWEVKVALPLKKGRAPAPGHFSSSGRKLENELENTINLEAGGLTKLNQQINITAPALRRRRELENACAPNAGPERRSSIGRFNMTDPLRAAAQISDRHIHTTWPMISFSKSPVQTRVGG